MKPPTVKLSNAEIFHGAVVGLMRHVANLRDRRKHAHGYVGTGWSIHIEGALGEKAVAKYLGVYHGGEFAFRGDDVADLQVRTTAGHDNRLIVHDTDPSKSPFVLVTGCEGLYVLRGWILGGEAKREEWMRDPTGKGRPAYFVPQDALEPVATLPVQRWN